MSIADRNYDNRLSLGTKASPLIVLMAISMILFVVLAFFKAFTYVRFPEGSDVTGYFNKNILSLFALSPDWHTLLNRPWTVLSATFTNVGVWSMFANMLWLWIFGYIFIDLTGNRKVAPVFIYSALAGALAFLITSSLVPALQLQQNYFYGAGPAILGIAVAATTIHPGYKLFPMLSGGISIWMITILYLVIDLTTIPANNPAIHLAHLAGGLTGFLFIFLLRKGYDGSGWMNRFYDWMINSFNPDKPVMSNSIVKNAGFYNTSNASYKQTPNLTQQKLDEILDKINLSGGYENLTEEEKIFLKRASEEDLRNK